MIYEGSLVMKRFIQAKTLKFVMALYVLFTMQPIAKIHSRSKVILACPEVRQVVFTIVALTINNNTNITL